MPVLKAKTPQTPATPKGAVVLNLGDLQADADRLREAARAEAEQILERAREQGRAEAERLHAEARAAGEACGREAGHAEGLEAGRAEAAAAWEAQLQGLNDGWLEALVGFETHAVSAAQAAERGVIELALKLAEKVVHRHVETVGAAALVDQARAALALVLDPCKLRLRVSEADHESGVLASALPEVLDRARQAEAVELIPDGAITPGGCVVEHGHGTIDATLETQLARLAELLLGGDQASSSPDGGTDQPGQETPVRLRPDAEPHDDEPPEDLTDAG